MHAFSMLLRRDNRWATALALFGVVFVAFRAFHQSMSIDEAGMWLTFTGNEHPDYFLAANQNHVLFTLLSHITAAALGTSELTLRLPSVFAATLYAAVGILLGFEFFPSSQLSRTLFLACLTLNPFILDYMVAARGYGLALACLMLAIYLLVRMRDQLSVALTERKLAYASSAIGLSIAANFSFGFVDAITLAIFVGPIFFAAKTTNEKIRIAMAAVAPPCIILYLLCGAALQHYTSREFVFGASNLVGTFGSLVDNSFDGPNDMVANTLVYPIVSLFRPLAILGMIVVLIWGLTLKLRQRIFSDVGIALLTIFIATTAVHEVLNLVTGLPLPVDRTALFYPPLIVLMIASVVSNSKVRQLRLATTTVFALTAIFFVFSLRENYFKAWRFDEHVKEAYDIVLSHIPPGQTSTLVADWKYVTVLNFYSSLNHYSVIPKLEEADTANNDKVPAGRTWYILYPFDQDAYIQAHRLKEVFRIRGTQSGDIVVATSK